MKIIRDRLKCVENSYLQMYKRKDWYHVFDGLCEKTCNPVHNLLPMLCFRKVGVQEMGKGIVIRSVHICLSDCPCTDLRNYFHTRWDVAVSQSSSELPGCRS